MTRCAGRAERRGSFFGGAAVLLRAAPPAERGAVRVPAASAVEELTRSPPAPLPPLRGADEARCRGALCGRGPSSPPAGAEGEASARRLRPAACPVCVRRLSCCFCILSSGLTRVSRFGFSGLAGRESGGAALRPVAPSYYIITCPTGDCKGKKQLFANCLPAGVPAAVRRGLPHAESGPPPAFPQRTRSFRTFPKRSESGSKNIAKQKKCVL